MKNLLAFLLVLTVFAAQAQFNRHQNHNSDQLNKFNGEKPLKLDLPWHEVMNAPKEPLLKPSVDIPNQFSINSRMPMDNQFWIGKTTNFYSPNGNLKATYTYDLLGNVRNSSFSFTFSKKD